MNKKKEKQLKTIRKDEKSGFVFDGDSGDGAGVGM